MTWHYKKTVRDILPGVVNYQKMDWLSSILMKYLIRAEDTPEGVDVSRGKEGAKKLFDNFISFYNNNNNQNEKKNVDNKEKSKIHDEL